MPIYEYQCRKCGTFEHSQSIKDKPLRKCPRCRSAVKKLVSASSFHLKGGGWYSDGYAKKESDSATKTGPAAGAEAATKPEAKPKAEPKAEAKPADSKAKSATRTGSTTP
jgi:putative FmdB family regulatory protein